MENKFVSPNNPILKKVAKHVPLKQINSSKIKKITQLMLRIIKGEQKKQKKGVGLAAPQIGITKRIILVDIAADGKGKLGNLKIFINPEIVWYSKTEKEWYEGCYSTGEVYGIVPRSISIKMQSYNQRGEFIKEKYTKYLARIFQHEVDHLNGKVFIDLIKNPNNLHWVKKSEFSLYRNKEAWRNWPKKYPLPLAYSRLKKV